MQLFLLTALTMIAFGANSVLTRAGVDLFGMDPVGFALLRTGAGAAVLAALVLMRGGGWARPRSLSPLWLALYMVGFSWAYRTLDAGVGALILFGGVQVTMFAGALLAGEAVRARRWVGMGLAVLGLGWLCWPEPGTGFDAAEVAAMLAGALGWGLYSLAGRREPDALAATAMNFVLCLPLVAVVALVLGVGDWPTGGVVLALVSGGITSGLGYALWYRVLPGLEASVAGVVQLSAPVVAVLGGALFLGEPVTLAVLGAGALILGGIAVAVTGQRRMGSSGS